MDLLPLFVIGWLFFGIVTSAVAWTRDLSPVVYFVVGALLGPIGLVLALVMPRGESPMEKERRTEDALRRYDADRPAPRPGSVDELAKLVEMRDAGHLTDDEFAAAKRKALGL